jgi:hypothetical protein
MVSNDKENFSYTVPLKEVQFICEQDGLPERELKTVLSESFLYDKDIQKAYLVRISYKCSDEYLVALCLSIASGHESSKVKKISNCFSRVFGKEQHLEILFLNSELESQVSKVCNPFYVRERRKRKPDFYMVSSEWKPLYEPRKCWVQCRFSYLQRNDLFLIKVKPNISYEDKKDGTTIFDEMVIASRHEGYTIDGIKEWPLYVHLIKLRKTIGSDVIKLSEDDIETIAWAELYPSLYLAKKAMRIYKK